MLGADMKSLFHNIRQLSFSMIKEWIQMCHYSMRTIIHSLVTLPYSAFSLSVGRLCMAYAFIRILLLARFQVSS